MRIKRSLPIILGVLLVVAAVALVVVLRKHAPPEAARLLPGADGFVYVNLQWMRRANLVGELPPVPHDPEYEQFIRQTGFQFERDLDEAAFAVHYPPPGPTSGNTRPVRFSEVFVGKIQADRLREYLRSISTAVENYHAVDIFEIPLEGRTLRVAILAVGIVAASNVDDPQAIHGMVDRSRKLASPFGGPQLLRQFYKEVPLASAAWAIARMQPAGWTSTPGPLNWGFLFAKPAVVVASIRYLGTVHFRADAFTGSDEEAKQVTDQLGTYLDVFRTAESTAGTSGMDSDVKALFDSLKIQQQKNQAVLTANVPVGFIRKMLAETPVEAAPNTTPVNPQGTQEEGRTKAAPK